MPRSSTLAQKLGADVNQPTLGEITSLIVVAQKDNLDAVQYLVVQLSADVNQAMRNGRTPVIVAAQAGHLVLLRLLIELGARTEVADHDADTALTVSARSGQFERMQYLLEETGANIDEVNKAGETIWGILVTHFETALIADVVDYVEVVEADLAALIALLWVLVLRSAPPPTLLALLSPESPEPPHQTKIH
jgi:ankyrin repeat protein